MPSEAFTSACTRAVAVAVSAVTGSPPKRSRITPPIAW